jgi:hypothetical protein
MGCVEARSSSLMWMGGALAPRVWAYAAALLAAFVLTYAIASSGSKPEPPDAASRALPDQRTPEVPRVHRLQDAVPLPEQPAGVSR